MDQNALILSVLQLVIDIFNRHQHAAGQPPLTDADVAEMKTAALAEGQDIIADWFTAKGLPPPV